MQSEPLTPIHVPQADISDDAPDEIFLKAVAEIDTQPLIKKRKVTFRWQDVLQTLLCLSLIVGGLVGVLWGAINYPTTMVTLFPVTHAVTITTALDVPLRTLGPVTLTRSATAQTTGHGHQNSRSATGVLTFYNGKLSPQFVPGGTMFTGNDGQKVTTDAALTIPAGNPPGYGTASIASHTLGTGQMTNIAADDINVAVSSDLLVKNGTAFIGGRDARDYRAVAQSDLDSLTATITHTLSQEIPQAFTLRTGEWLVPINCHTITTTNHQTGNEAQSVTLTSTQTCNAVAYGQAQLDTQATVAFTAETQPAPHYQLIGTIQTTVTSVTPFQVRLAGTWVYTISPTYEQYLAEKIAGDTPQQARAYLIKTGVISQATIPSILPQATYIKFLVLMG